VPGWATISQVGRDLPRKINPTRLGFAASSQEITWVPGDERREATLAVFSRAAWGWP
jgi:hypothetical protein